MLGVLRVAALCNSASLRGLSASRTTSRTGWTLLVTRGHAHCFLAESVAIHAGVTSLGQEDVAGLLLGLRQGYTSTPPDEHVVAAATLICFKSEHTAPLFYIACSQLAELCDCVETQLAELCECVETQAS